MTVTTRIRSPGRARNKPLKPLRGECRVYSGEPVVTTLVCFFICTRGCGCSGHPAFPAPSSFRGHLPCIARAHRAARLRTHIWRGTSLRGAKRRSNPFFAFFTRWQWIASPALAMTAALPPASRLFENLPKRTNHIQLPSHTRAFMSDADQKPARIRSARLTIFWHCGGVHFSSRTGSERGLGNKPSRVVAEDAVPKGLAMLIRSCLYGVQGGAASAVRTQAIPAASLPTLSIGGLLLICP